MHLALFSHRLLTASSPGRSLGAQTRVPDEIFSGRNSKVGILPCAEQKGKGKIKNSWEFSFQELGGEGAGRAPLGWENSKECALGCSPVRLVTLRVLTGSLA